MMKHVLIADDDPGIQDVLGIILKGAGYKATIISNADAIFNNEFIEPDIFIIDKQLSNIDGLEVCRFLKNRKEFSHTPVILFSAGGNLQEIAKAAGADDFLEKPFLLETLLQLIEKHIGIGKNDVAR